MNVTICHFERISGKHGGRRHLKLPQIAFHKVQTLRACGMEFAGKGDRRTPGQSGQVDHSAPSDAKPAPVITAESVAKDANVSKATARNAIKDAKKAEQEAKAIGATQGRAAKLATLLQRLIGATMQAVGMELAKVGGSGTNGSK